MNTAVLEAEDDGFRPAVRSKYLIDQMPFGLDGERRATKVVGKNDVLVAAKFEGGLHQFNQGRGEEERSQNGRGIHVSFLLKKKTEEQKRKAVLPELKFDTMQ